jgi:hypothetical protein
LSPRLLSSTGDLATAQRVRRADALTRLMANNRLMDEAFVHRLAENGIV